VERFFALATELGRRGEGPLVQAALAGGKGTKVMSDWRGSTHAPARDPLKARDDAVFARLGQVPCLLSEPSWVDLRIDPADLVTRLLRYAQAGATASAADLFIALTRTDTSLLDLDMLAALDGLDVPVSKRDVCASAGSVARRYLTQPYPDPGLVAVDNTWQWGQQAPCRGPLEELGMHLVHTPATPTGYQQEDAAWISLFPGWGDAACSVLRADGLWGEQGTAARQLARRAGPLPPGAAVNLLDVSRTRWPSWASQVASDTRTAVVEAWERGLLRPGVPDPHYLRWATEPHSLAATAAGLAEVAADGVLAVVWPLLDDIMVLATSAPRLPPGTADVAQALLTLLPEALAGVSTGVADPGVLDLPGIRTLAARPGSSQAVKTARQVVAAANEG